MSAPGSNLLRAEPLHRHHLAPSKTLSHNAWLKKARSGQWISWLSPVPARWDRVELSPNQINDQFAARAARIKANLRLTPGQEKNWPAVESAVKDIGKRNGDLQIALRTERAQLKGPFDVIQQMREEARFLGERSADQKALADAAQPLYVSLDDQQKRRFANELQGLGHWPEGY
jgi:LTXXQ motif family protein